MKHDTIYFATTCSALKIFFGSINALLLSALKDQKLLLTESWEVIISQFKESLNIPPMLVVQYVYRVLAI